MANTRNTRSIRRLTQFSLLLAIQIILGVTPLGLIMLPTASITLMHIPVIIAGIVMGPLYGGLLGGAFGIISMIKATTSAVSPIDMLFSPFVSGYPLPSLIMVLVPRILLGVFAALLFRAGMKVIKKTYISIAISAILSTVLHTVMVLGCLFLFFDALPLAQVFGTIITLNGGLEILAALVLAVPICGPLLKYNERHK